MTRKMLGAFGVVAALLTSGCESRSQPEQKNADERSPARSEPPSTAAQPVGPLPGQPTFKSAEEAVEALDQAAVAKDLAKMLTIVGLPLEDVRDGDASQDAESAGRFAEAYDEYHEVVPNPEDPKRAQLIIGKENYPVASPLIEAEGSWYFDSAVGKDELRTRVIGENELDTIGVCGAYVQAQYEYYSEDRNDDDVLEFAQHLASTKGHDGLYWPTEGDKPKSPLGPLIAEAQADGNPVSSPRTADEPKPYHGYLFKVLTSQGPNAPGGEYSYIINGHMLAGFGLVAAPAQYGKTGVMTFVVGANGKIYQKDFGGNPPEEVMTRYNPDGSWTLVQ
jgi:hypothetical protein